MTTRPPDFVDAKASLALLGVRPQTLYAYVSRGAIRSVPQPGTKAHLYSRADIERVAGRAAARAGHAAVAAGAMDHGLPIVSSEITEITVAGPCYRGCLATDLARQNVGFEAVCELLWGNPLDIAKPTAWRIPPHEQDLVTDEGQNILHGAVPHRLYEALTMLVLQLERTRGDSARSLGGPHEARFLVCAIARALECTGKSHAPTISHRAESIASTLIRSFGVESTPKRVHAVNALLVLLADHELPPGTLAVRAAASGGANLFNCIAVGICASTGTEISGQYEAVDQFLGAEPCAASLRARALNLQRCGKRIPGFTHPLYFDGDPRAQHLLSLAIDLAEDSFNMRQVQAFLQWAQEELGDYPRHEFAVVCLVRALRLPAWSAGALFLVARMAGWAAHVMEQRGAAGIWRPRARYVGNP